MVSNELEHPSGKPDIRERTFSFALRIVRLVRALGSDLASQGIARQVLRSGTSVGANVEEAQGSHSRADFARRMNIARAEARETLYWLRLITDSELLPRRRTADLIREADEIVRILVAIVKTARVRRDDPPRTRFWLETNPTDADDCAVASVGSPRPVPERPAAAIQLAIRHSPLATLP